MRNDYLTPKVALKFCSYYFFQSGCSFFDTKIVISLFGFVFFNPLSYASNHVSLQNDCSVTGWALFSSLSVQPSQSMSTQTGNLKLPCPSSALLVMKYKLQTAHAWIQRAKPTLPQFTHFWVWLLTNQINKMNEVSPLLLKSCAIWIPCCALARQHFWCLLNSNGLLISH